MQGNEAADGGFSRVTLSLSPSADVCTRPRRSHVIQATFPQFKSPTIRATPLTANHLDRESESSSLAELGVTCGGLEEPFPGNQNKKKPPESRVNDRRTHLNCGNTQIVTVFDFSFIIRSSDMQRCFGAGDRVHFHVVQSLLLEIMDIMVFTRMPRKVSLRRIHLHACWFTPPSMQRSHRPFISRPESYPR